MEITEEVIVEAHFWVWVGGTDGKFVKRCFELPRFCFSLQGRVGSVLWMRKVPLCDGAIATSTSTCGVDALGNQPCSSMMSDDLPSYRPPRRKSWIFQLARFD